MTSKFKVGDRVRCVYAEGTSLLKEDGIYNITAVRGEWVDTDGLGGWNPFRFELVASAPTFKIGDNVDSRHSGWRGTVERVYDNGRIDVYDGNFTATYGAADFKLAPPPPRHAIVARMYHDGPGPSSHPFVHADSTAARTEAERLATANPGTKFGVYELVSLSAAEKPAVKTEAL